MSEKIDVEKKRRKNTTPPRGGGRAKKSRRSFSAAEKMKAVQLRLEEGFKLEDVCAEMGMVPSCLSRWISLYRQFGEAGLQPAAYSAREPKLPAAVRDKIIEIKKQEPAFGIKRISQWLRRWFFLQASAETVRQTLKSEGLMEDTVRPPRNVTRPRFFERATPNQMWQSDIFTFRLGGRYAYLIAFMDDYSRFLTGADLFRSPTAANVLEVFRVAAGEFQPPKEMLTDQGRQYTTWRGVSRFEAEMKKNGIHHFKSRPHHPMTLGKVERFWETIWQEFLSRAQFESFEAARERIRLWVKYYNHKRPHQGIEGLCPADRYFEIASQMRKTIEAGIQENLLEMALRGQPGAPAPDHARVQNSTRKTGPKNLAGLAAGAATGKTSRRRAAPRSGPSRRRRTGGQTGPGTKTPDQSHQNGGLPSRERFAPVGRAPLPENRRRRPDSAPIGLGQRR
jgi:transposase InsO family protein